MGVYYACDENDSEYLEHFGILGMKWGVRRFQNPDGSLTAEGRERYYGTKQSDKLTMRLKKAPTYTLDVGHPWMGGENKNKVHNIVRGSSDTLVANIRRMPQMKAVAAAVRDDWKEAEKHRSEMNKIEKSVCNKNTIADLSKKAAEDIYRKRPNEANSISLEETTAHVLQQDYEYFFRHAPAYTYGFKYWLASSNDPKAKQYLKEKKNYDAAYKSYLKNSKKALDEFLREYADLKVEDYFGMKVSLSDKGQAILDSIMTTWDGYEEYYNNGESIPIGKISRLVL